MKGYIKYHCIRLGRSRYAVKRVRDDLLNHETMLNAIAYLAMEAKFMSSIRHPNICKMRATAGIPGRKDFMVIMDCLNTTLRERMEEWKQQQQQQRGGGKKTFLERLLLQGSNNNSKKNKKKNEKHTTQPKNLRKPYFN